MVCGTLTRRRITVTAPGHNEVLEVSACDLHISAAKRQVNTNLIANGIQADIRPTRFNPKKNRQDRRKFMRGQSHPNIPGSTNTAMGPDEVVTK